MADIPAYNYALLKSVVFYYISKSKYCANILYFLIYHKNQTHYNRRIKFYVENLIKDIVEKGRNI